MSTSVVITGIASIGPHGHDDDDLAAALRAGRPLAQVLDEPEPHLRRRVCREGAPCPKIDLSPWVAPRVARRMSMSSQWIVAAGRMALEHAGWTEGNESDLAVCFASAFGPSDFINKLLRQILRDGPATASPFYFTDCVANAPAGQLAIAVQARGANFTISQRESGPLLALIQGTREIRAGRCTAALAGAADAMDDALMAILDRMGALAPDAASTRPFDRRRCGVLPGEGVGCLLLESTDQAASRGAAPLARVTSTVRAFDPSAPATGWGTGHEVLADTLKDSLAKDGIALDSIDAVVSGASGARDGDRLEARILRAVFRDRVPPVLVPKAVVGEYGAGGVLVPAVLAVQGGSFAAPMSFAEVDADLGLAPSAVDLAAPCRVLVTALGSGGAAAWTVLESP